MSAASPLAAVSEALGFQPLGERAGNLTVGRGVLDGRTVHVALVENRLASGSIGGLEAKRLGALLVIAAKQRAPLVLFLDSAGARVSEGLPALGAFRALFRSALDAALVGAPIAAVLGRNCYGGASMLAHLARERLYGPDTQLAMSGPSVLATAAGTTVLDEMFKAMAQASITAEMRAKASAANRVWQPNTDVAQWLREALVPPGDPLAGFRLRHEALGARLPKAAGTANAESVKRRELEKLFPEGYQACERDGLLTGEARREGRTEALLGLIGRKPVGAERAWRFSEQAWRLADARVERVHVLLDCESHAARLDDERIVLSEYLVGTSLALAALKAGGSQVRLTILGRAGGGVYVGLAAPARHVAVVFGAQVQVLPGSAITAILGEGADKDAAPTAGEVVEAGVADEELKLGLAEGAR